MFVTKKCKDMTMPMARTIHQMKKNSSQVERSASLKMIAVSNTVSEGIKADDDRSKLN